MSMAYSTGRESSGMQPCCCAEGSSGFRVQKEAERAGIKLKELTVIRRRPSVQPGPFQSQALRDQG